MARQSEKRIEAFRQERIKYYKFAAVGGMLISFTLNLLFGELLSLYGIGIYLGFAIVTWFTYKNIDRALELGIEYDGYNDLFCINVFVQVFSALHNWFYFVYLMVPIYWLYKGALLCFGYLRSSAAGQPEAADDGKKKKEKKEKVKFKTVRKQQSNLQSLYATSHPCLS
eukprot:TRINITY_DN1887_c0_g1_i2.p2 TRINITY_DN1887_c0_g1~~TRINITY_DN1887_c0_g1_i2.p2  ORF type:complete len:169 (-),score=18.37 TRINITY_DN1887_c0_g1_i2:227-733(-)